MRRIFIFLILALPCFAQTAKTRTDLYTEIDTLFADTGATDITPADVRTSLKDIIASAPSTLTDGTVVITTDSRLSDARTPLAHASSHDAGGSDPLSLAESQIRNLTTDLAGKAAVSHTHTALQISDATVLGRTLMTIADAASARTAIGAGTSNFDGTYGSLSGKPTFATVATTGAYSDLTGKPTLGTAAALDVPATGDASTTQVVKGTDSRLTNARTPTAHTHVATDISDSTTVGRAVLKAADAATARTAIGAGTSNFDGTYGSLSGKPTLATVATTGAYSDLSGKPTLGTAAALDVPATGDASTAQVVKGTDSRLTDARTPTAHTHAESDVTNLVSDLAGKEPTQTPVTQAEAEAGTSTSIRSWTPQRVAQAIAALAPAGGGGSDQRNLFDFSKLEFYDEFLANANGALQWRSVLVGSGGTNTWGSNPTANVYASHEMRTGTTTNSGCCISLAGGSLGQLVAMDGSQAFDVQFRIATGTAISDYRFRVGLCTSSGVLEPTDGVFIRYDVTEPDSHFRGVARASSVDTLGADSFSAPTTNTLYTFRLWSTGAGDVNFSVNGGTTVTLTSGLPSGRGVPFVALCTDSTVDQRCYIQAIAGRVIR